MVTLSLDPAKARLPWPGTLLGAIVFYGVVWSLFIGGVGAVLVWSDINDAARRADLAQRGVHAVATVTALNCGKSNTPRFRYPVKGRAPYENCSLDEWSFLQILGYGIGSKVQIVYDPAFISRLYVTPNDQVPQRDVSQIWPRWRFQTALMLLIYLPVQSLILYFGAGSGPRLRSERSPYRARALPVAPRLRPCSSAPSFRRRLS